MASPLPGPKLSRRGGRAAWSQWPAGCLAVAVAGAAANTFLAVQHGVNAAHGSGLHVCETNEQRRKKQVEAANLNQPGDGGSGRTYSGAWAPPPAEARRGWGSSGRAGAGCRRAWGRAGPGRPSASAAAEEHIT